MSRLLFISRYRDATQYRKVALLAQQENLDVVAIFPRLWHDDLLRIEFSSVTHRAFRQIALPMVGSAADPHRAVYRTLTFGMRTFRPHIIHAEEEPDSLAALQIGLARRLWAPQAKLFFHTWQNIDRPKRWYVRWVLRSTLAVSDAVFCANQEAAGLLQRWGYTRPTPVIPAIGVDTTTFLPCPPPSDQRSFVVGYVGRLVPEKGIDTLIDAFARLQRCFPRIPLQLRIVGGGPAEADLRAYAASLALAEQVTFLPPVTPAQVAQQLCALDVLVLPSRTTSVWKEQLGRVLLEAMACKIPVVGSDSGAIPEVIGDGGFVFPEGDAESLAKRLEQLMESPALRRTLAERGYEWVHGRYSQRHLTERTVDFYRAAMS